MPERSSAVRLPLTPRVFHLLLSLVDGEQHGYAMMKDVEARSDGQVTIGPGTLYEAIHRLSHGGLIAECGAPARGADDERRRYYRLTRLGRRTLEAESRRLDALVAHARRKGLVSRGRA